MTLKRLFLITIGVSRWTTFTRTSSAEHMVTNPYERNILWETPINKQPNKHSFNHIYLKGWLHQLKYTAHSIIYSFYQTGRTIANLEFYFAWLQSIKYAKTTNNLTNTDRSGVNGILFSLNSLP